MTQRQQWGIVAGIVLLLAVVLGAGVHFLGDELFPVSVGSKAPPIHGVTLDSTKRQKTLADYKGKVVLLNVWATWCEPCRVEMPSIEKLHKEFGPRGLAVVAISVDDPGSETRIAEFVKELGLTFEVLHDPKQVTTRNYQITGYPETFLIARDGVIRKKLIGAAPEVQALVSGRAADLVKLYATPLVLRRTVSGDVPDTLMLDVTPADVHVPAELSEAVHVLDVQPRAVMLRFESSGTRRIPVLNDGRVVVRSDSVVHADTSSSRDLIFDPDRVRVTGPRRVVRQLRGVRPYSLSIAWGDTLPHVADLDTAGLGVRVEPTQVRVRSRAP